MRVRKFQRRLMQFFKPENDFEAREARTRARRQDLLGYGCDCLIPAIPPNQAIAARRRLADQAVQGDHDHTVANPATGAQAGEGRSARAKVSREAAR